jgi:hypothetical protein
MDRMPEGFGRSRKQEPGFSYAVPLGPGQMIAGMTKRSHSCAGRNPVLADVVLMDSRLMIAGMTLSGPPSTFPLKR